MQDQIDELRAHVAWTRLTSGILRGATHSLGNRAHALAMVMSAVEPSEPLGDELVEALNAEAVACAELVKDYRLLNFAERADNEACLLRDVVPEAMRLWKYHIDSDGRTWHLHEATTDCPPVLAPPAALTQCALLLLVAYGTDASAPAASLTLDLRSDGHEVVAEFSANPSGVVPDDAVAAIRWLLRNTGARIVLSKEGERSAVEVVLPTLAAARAKRAANT